MSRKPLFYIIFLSFFIVTVVTSGIIFYSGMLDAEKNQSYQNLSSFANFKINQIYNWRNERISDAKFFQSNQKFLKSVNEFIQDPSDRELKLSVTEWLGPIKENHEYSDIIIINSDYAAYSLFGSSYKVNSRDRFFLEQCRNENKVLLGGFHKDSSGISSGIYASLLLPGNNKVFAFLKIKIDPYINLYPLLESVPITSSSAESFIVRKEGDSVLFLCNLKFLKDAALNLKIPLSETKLPAAMAVNGKIGIFEGLDYNGNKVVADLNKIPDSEWFIVSKINLAEVYAPVRKQAAYLLVGVLTLIIICGLIFYSVWRNENLKHLKKELEAERQNYLAELAMKKSEEKFSRVFHNSPVPMALADAEQYRTIDVNAAFETLYGYSREEVIGKTSQDVHLYDDMKNRERTVALLKDKRKIRNLELTIRRKNSEVRTVLINVEYLEIEGRECLLTISQDITDRKKAEENLRRSEQHLHLILDNVNEGILLAEAPEGKILAISKWGMDHTLGRSKEALLDIPLESYLKQWDIRDINSGEKVVTENLPLAYALKGKTVTNKEYITVRPDGHHAVISVNALPIYDETNENIAGAIATWQDISLRKEYERKLASSEERFYKAFDSNPNALVISSIEDGRILEVNQTFIDLYGYTREETLGKTSIELNMFADPVQRAEAISVLMKDGKLRNFELKLKLRSGEVRIAQISIEFLQTTDSRTMLTTIQDITEKKLAELALAESEERFRRMFEAHTAVMLIVDPETGGIADANPSAMQFYGYSYEKLLSMKVQDINQLHQNEIFRRMQEVKDKVHTFHVFPHRLSNGTIRIVEVYSSPLELKQKTFLFSIIHDVTEREQIQVKLNEALGNLKDKETNLLEAQKLAHLGSFSIDLEKNSYIWTDELYNIFEIESGKEIRLGELYEYVHPADIELLRSSVINAIADKQETLRKEFRIITPKNNVKYLDYIDNFYFNDKGKLIRRFGIMMDITERKVTQIKMQELLNDLSRSNKDLEAFAYSASHDLQEPIRMIKTYAQLINMTSRMNLSGSAQEYLKFIEEGASRMQYLVNDLLAYSRISTTHQEFKEVDCNAVLKDVLNDLKLKIEDEKAVIHVSGLPKVKGSYNLLRQLFQNFIHNSLKFRSARTPEIKIDCEKRKDVWLFSISDNGIGIDEIFYEKIFVIFQRLHEREKYPGTGIGLAMCKKIIERHGGQICVESEPGKGSTFYFTLPV